MRVIYVQYSSIIVADFENVCAAFYALLIESKW